MSSAKAIARATATILILTLFSRILGLGREAAIAFRFGATEMTDAFVVAFTIPNIFYQTVGVALATVIVPVYTEYAVQGRREDAWRILSMVINAVIVSLVIVVFLGIIGAPLITRMLGAGLSPDTMQLATMLTALMLPAILFKSLAGVLGGILNANNIFGPPALGPAILNIAIILSALFGGIWLGIYGLAVGTVVGAVLFVVIQLPALRQINFKYSAILSFREPIVKRVIINMWPVMLATGIVHAYTIIDLWLASGLDGGSIAVLNYARKLVLLPQAIFVVAVTKAIFPTLSKLVAEGKTPEMIITLQRGVRIILLLAVPGAVGLIVLREPIVSLLFERGAFDAEATVNTATALLYFSYGLVGLCLYLPLTRGFYALHDTRSPLMVSILTLGVKLILSLFLVRSMEYAGLALSTSITVMINTIILAVLLHFRLPGLFDRSFFSFTGCVFFAATVMGYMVYIVDKLLSACLIAAWWALTLRIGINFLCGAAFFGALAWILRLEELQYFVGEFIKIFHYKSRVGTL